ncbi:MAG: hypothetical protein R3B70_46365 [Polyangiaceae bacterium]
MDLIGHCAVAALSGVHPERDVFGPGVVDLMLPNVLHCHDWGYQHLWDLSSFEDHLRPVARRMQTHIVADWVIHYGGARTGEKRKVGWAYRRMGLAHRRAREFFEEARCRGLLRSDAVDPAGWSRKRKLDFAHSITEYALDFLVAPMVMTASRLADIKHHLGRVAGGASPGYAPIDATAAALRVETDQPHDVVLRSIEALAHDAAAAEGPESFAVATTMRKYGFHIDRRSAQHVRTFIAGISADLNAAECRELCVAIARIAADPSSIPGAPVDQPDRPGKESSPAGSKIESRS